MKSYRIDYGMTMCLRIYDRFRHCGSPSRTDSVKLYHCCNLLRIRRWSQNNKKV